MAGRNLQMRGYTRLVSPNMGRDVAGQRAREGSSHANMNNNAEKINHGSGSFITLHRKVEISFLIDLIKT